MTPPLAPAIRAIFTCGFSGFESDALWFPPYCSESQEIGDDLFEHARQARARVDALLKAGSAMAARSRPDLAAPLAALARASFELDFFDFEGGYPALGWFRLSASAPGATPEALSAVEEALAASRAPLRSAQCSGALADFGSGRSDHVPASFAGDALQATASVGAAFASSGASRPLASADLVELRSADGSRRAVACVPSCCASSDPLGDVKTMAKLAQACVSARAEARKAHDDASDASDAFFEAVQGALLGAQGAPMPKRSRVELPEGSFFAVPESLCCLSLAGLPTEGFDAASQLFMRALAARFGALAASSKAPTAPFEQSKASLADLAALSPMFSKLPAAQPAVEADSSPAEPGRSAP